MAVTEEARAARDAKLDELHERLTGAVETLVSGEDWARALEFAARFRSRSFNNTLLIWVQHEAAFEAGRVPNPVPSHVAGYRQWQQLGRQVQKGQQGYMIFAPVTGRFATSTPADASSWRRLDVREKPKPGEVVRSMGWPPEAVARVREGLHDVAAAGTGRRVRVRGLDVAAKTGTAEYDAGGVRRKNTWVTAFAPFSQPTAALAIIVENGESGGLTVAPMVRDVLVAMFGEPEPAPDEKPPLPVENAESRGD